MELDSKTRFIVTYRDLDDMDASIFFDTQIEMIEWVDGQNDGDIIEMLEIEIVKKFTIGKLGV